jgi:hypothetical protein
MACWTRGRGANWTRPLPKVDVRPRLPQSPRGANRREDQGAARAPSRSCQKLAKGTRVSAEGLAVGWPFPDPRMLRRYFEAVPVFRIFRADERPFAASRRQGFRVNLLVGVGRKDVLAIVATLSHVVRDTDHTSKPSHGMSFVPQIALARVACPQLSLFSTFPFHTHPPLKGPPNQCVHHFKVGDCSGRGRSSLLESPPNF